MIIKEIDKNDLLPILSTYFSNKYNDYITVKEKHGIKNIPVGYNIFLPTIDLEIYLEVIIKSDDLITPLTSPLSKEEIIEALNDKFYYSDYEVISIDYIAGIKLDGCFNNEKREPYFDGVRMTLKEKNKMMTLGGK